MSLLNLKAGDTIKCYDNQEMYKVFTQLKKLGIRSDFIYEKDGEIGKWILILPYSGRKERNQ